MKVQKGDVIYLLQPIQQTDWHLEGGNRPYVVVSNTKGNLHSEICLVVPITSKNRRNIPTHVSIDNGRHIAMTEQIIPIPQSNIERIHHRLTQGDMLKLNKALMIALGV